MQSKFMGVQNHTALLIWKKTDLSQKTFTEKKDIQNDGEIAIFG